MKQTSFSQKLTLCLIAGLVTGATFRRLGSKYLINYLPLDVVYILAYIVLLLGILLAFVWHHQDKAKRINLDYYNGLRQLIAVVVATDLIMFGIQKFLGLQMIVPLGLLDTPFSSFSGENLVWAFFRYSYAFVSVIALMQIISALLLFYPKTRLLGCMLALPMFVFILLIDFFYEMPMGVMLHGAILLTAIFYFLLPHSKRLLFALWVDKPLVKPSQFWLWTVPLIVVPIFCMFQLQHPDKHPEITAKYAVSDLKIDKKQVTVKSSADSVLTHIYFDLDDDVVFRWNDYRRQRIGRYKLGNEGKISIAWRYPNSKSPAFVGKLEVVKEGLKLNGMMDGQYYDMLLVRSK